MNDSKYSILLVEDNPDDEELTVMALQGAGIKNPIHVVRDGQQALEYLFGTQDKGRDQAGRPLLVILDLQLPKVDGFQVVTKIREMKSTRSLPVVILSSSDIDEDIARSYELGANSYIRKPMEFAEFASAIRQLGRYWLSLNKQVRRGN